MGHHVQAIIGSRTALEQIVRQYPHSTVIDLTQGLALLPMTGDLHDALETRPDEIAVRKPPFMLLGPKIMRLMAKHSEERGLVYFETDYAGGHGTQGAVVVRDNAIVFGPESGQDTINSALRIVGVRVTDGCTDEFASIGLDRHRGNDSWLESGEG